MKHNGHTSAVKFQCSLELNVLLRGRRLGVGLLGSVETTNISLVVLCVVESHDLARDMRLEGLYMLHRHVHKRVTIRRGRW